MNFENLTETFTKILIKLVLDQLDAMGMVLFYCLCTDQTDSNPETQYCTNSIDSNLTQIQHIALNKQIQTQKLNFNTITK